MYTRDRLTIDGLRDHRCRSGFRHVRPVPNGFQAYQMKGSPTYGEVRSTAEEAAEDYCRRANIYGPKKVDLDQDGHLYCLIQDDDHGQPEFVKLGFTAQKNPRQRLGQAQGGNPKWLRLHGVKPGKRSDEYMLLMKYRPQRVRGEWFTVTDEILSEFDADAE